MKRNDFLKSIELKRKSQVIFMAEEYSRIYSIEAYNPSDKETVAFVWIKPVKEKKVLLYQTMMYPNESFCARYTISDSKQPIISLNKGECLIGRSSWDRDVRIQVRGYYEK